MYYCRNSRKDSECLQAHEGFRKDSNELVVFIPIPQPAVESDL